MSTLSRVTPRNVAPPLSVPVQRTHGGMYLEIPAWRPSGRHGPCPKTTSPPPGAWLWGPAGTVPGPGALRPVRPPTAAPGCETSTPVAPPASPPPAAVTSVAAPGVGADAAPGAAPAASTGDGPRRSALPGRRATTRARPTTTAMASP
jgi:hypothetical protein